MRPRQQRGLQFIYLRWRGHPYPSPRAPKRLQPPPAWWDAERRRNGADTVHEHGVGWPPAWPLAWQ